VTYNPERLKLVWDKLLLGAGVKMLLHAWLCDVELAKDGRIFGAILQNKRGFLRVTGKRFVDASGDADLCHLAAIPYEKAGDIEPAQTLTTTFRMCNVDLGRFEAEGGKKMLMAKMFQRDARRARELPQYGSDDEHGSSGGACCGDLSGDRRRRSEHQHQRVARSSPDDRRSA
jgi:hypothetical protein